VCFVVRVQLPNAAWNNFLIDGLDFTDWMIGVVSIAGSVFAWLGQSVDHQADMRAGSGGSGSGRELVYLALCKALAS
jgi:hypothetical protein